MSSDQPFLTGCWEHVVIEAQSSCFGCCRKFYCSFILACTLLDLATAIFHMCSGDSTNICKPFVLGCFRMFWGCGAQWPCRSEKTRSVHELDFGGVQSNLFCHFLSLVLQNGFGQSVFKGHLDWNPSQLTCHVCEVPKTGEPLAASCP